MIRHSSSFFISLVFHIVIAGLFIFTYRHVVSTKKEEIEKKVCIELCNVVEQKPIITPKPIIEPKPIAEPKPVIKKPKPLPKPKPIIKKPKPLPKPVVKKEIVKKVPVVMPEPIVEEEVVEEKKVVEEVEETPTEVVEQKPSQQPKVTQQVENIQSKEVKPEEEYMQENIAKIVQLLRDNLYYPRRARAMREEGKVMVKFVLLKDATVHSVEIISSKSKILSRSAIKTIEDLSGDFPKPKEELTLQVPIEYSLR